MKKTDTGGRTLLWSMLMSAPGPLIVALGLLTGRSATQLADLVRRSAELLAIVMAYLTYHFTAQSTNAAQKMRLERRSNLFVGAMMCLGGSIMLALAFVPGNEEKGNVLPGLAVALLGVIANTIFWRRYTRLHRAAPNAILAVQARLYRAKSMVDGCVTLALMCVLLLPGSSLADALDRAGSAVVALYLFFCGAKTIREHIRRAPPSS